MCGEYMYQIELKANKCYAFTRACYRQINYVFHLYGKYGTSIKPPTKATSRRIHHVAFLYRPTKKKS